MKRALAPLVFCCVLACGDGGGPAVAPRVLVHPLLDSLFVGDSLPTRTAVYLDARGDAQPTGAVRWSSSDSNVFQVDSISGRIAGRSAGAALIVVRANGITGSGLLVVSKQLDLRLLLDTIYLMPGDTFTVPTLVKFKNFRPPPVSFSTSVNGVFTIDPSTGLITATGFGGPLPFTAQVETEIATGAVEVVQLIDTIGGKGYFTLLGTVIRRQRAGARAVNYRRQGDTVTFRVSLPVVSQGIAVENMLLTLRDSVNAAGTFPIDSISPAELFGTGADPVCRPPRPWALWSVQTTPPLRAASRRDGSLVITQVMAVAHGRAISGRFTFMGQRTDLYDDPLAALPIRGTFVAPLIADPARSCR